MLILVQWFNSSGKRRQWSVGTLKSYKSNTYRACLLITWRYGYTNLLESFRLFWNVLDLELLKFFWNHKSIFIFFHHFNFKNSVTKPCVILVYDSLKILRLWLIYSWAVSTHFSLQYRFYFIWIYVKVKISVHKIRSYY